MPTGKRKRRSIWWIYEPFYTYHLHNLRVHSVWHEVSAGNLQERHAGTEIAEVFEKSESWARVTYYRAKQKIIERMNENE